MFKAMLRKSWLILCYLYHRFNQEGFSYRAASLAYATLLAIVPLAITTFTILSFFPFFHGIEKQLQNFVLTNFVAESANVISAQLENLLLNTHKLSTVNIVFLALLNLLMLYNINQAFNSVWRTHFRIHLSITFLIYLIVLLLSPLVLGGVLVLAGFIFKLSLTQRFLTSTPSIRLIFVLIPNVVTFITFTVFNWILPSCRVKFAHAALGGLITTIIFELAKAVFVIYLGKYSAYKLIYGALATLPLFLIWLYTSWLIILLGALVTNLIAQGIPKNWQRESETF